ncbi:MAG: geranylgeranylglyceryl/heptaprenylglyceryl phosphate synthase [Candidatus Marinimicrobia bacterium]|nr:geranylgeranylglyceryl/heptaprenylglyceryl phosphate synthase [Candidatus Neomarinimicrobiota bacterium]
MSLVYSHLLSIYEKRGGIYAVLLDPDKKNHDIIESMVTKANESDVDVLLVGGSLMMDGKSHDRVRDIKEQSKIPVVFFPGSASQLNSYFDAVLFLSVLSGRNPHYLIGEQVISAPIIKDLGLETIPTGYLLLDGGAHSTVEFMSGSKPIPMNRPDITVAHALAAEYMGMKFVYLEAGSGAKRSVSEEIIKQCVENLNINIIVGGGIKSPQEAASKIEAGASMVVTGSVLETSQNNSLMKEIADAIHKN